MKRLVKALEIFIKYNPDASTHCEHDVLSICGIEPDDVSDEDKNTLYELGFHVGSSCGEEGFQSFEWGSC